MGEREKVYCKDCVHIREPVDKGTPWDYTCNAPQNMIRTRNWYGEGQRPKQFPQEINAKNDCNYFIDKRSS